MRVTALLERKSDVLWLPPQAIRTFEGRRFVVVQDGAAQRRVDVKIGIEGADRLEIGEGLSEGQTVIGQ
jgi:multidrug efflux pump subunit AcrA (membrane-fusion protein)